MNYDDYIRRGILANNQFGITEVNDLEDINYTFFVKDKYKEVVQLIKDNDIEGIKSIRSADIQTTEYLDIMMFADQNGRKYVVTAYDTDALEQDPQIIGIYPLEN